MSSKMKLVGIHMTPQAQQREAMLADSAQLQKAFAGDRINPRLLPAPRSPMTPVFADEAGNRFLMQSTPRGMVATPMPDSPDGDLLGSPEAGGFVPWSQLQGMAKDAPDLGYPSNTQLVEAAKKALLNGPANETEAGEKKSPPKKPNPFVQVGQSMLQGLPNMIAGQLADATQQAGSIAGGLKNIVDGNSFDLGKLGAGIAGQLAGMAASMGLNAMWAVDDESSTGEQVAHKMAEGLVNDIAAELVKAAIAGSFQGMGGNLANGTFAGKLWNGLGKASPAANNPALRMGDVDTTLSPVVAGSGSVFIEGLAAAREGDAVGLLGPPMVYNGSKSVSMNSMPAGRALGKYPPSETTVGIFALGAARTFIGGAATGNVPPKPEVPSDGPAGSHSKSEHCSKRAKELNDAKYKDKTRDLRTVQVVDKNGKSHSVTVHEVDTSADYENGMKPSNPGGYYENGEVYVEKHPNKYLQEAAIQNELQHAEDDWRNGAVRDRIFQDENGNNLTYLEREARSDDASARYLQEKADAMWATQEWRYGIGNQLEVYQNRASALREADVEITQARNATDPVEIQNHLQAARDIGTKFDNAAWCYVDSVITSYFPNEGPHEPPAPPGPPNLEDCPGYPLIVPQGGCVPPETI